MTSSNPVVSRAEWLTARKALLEQEKAFLKQRDALSAVRRDLPWVRIEKNYTFDTPGGEQTLADLFDGRSQLIIYHFMFGPDWEEGCKSCSFFSDGLDGVAPHLAARDVSLVAASRAPLVTLTAFKARMNWHFKWVSSNKSDFNFDFAVSFPEDKRSAPNYNFETMTFNGEEAPGLSVFTKNEDGEVFHTYSTYARGLDALIGTYQFLDLVPKGRDEESLSFPMAWVRFSDSYGK